MQDTLGKGRKAGDEVAAKAFTENILPLLVPLVVVVAPLW
jgi:hypothetical protein